MAHKKMIVTVDLWSLAKVLSVARKQYVIIVY